MLWVWLNCLNSWRFWNVNSKTKAYSNHNVFDDVSIMFIGIPINDFDELVVESTCYFGKHKHVWTRICQTKCDKKSYSNHVWTWTHRMFLSMCHCVALKLTIWIRGQFLSFTIPTKLVELYDWIKGEHCVFWIWL